MRKLTLLSSVFLMGLVLLASPLGAQSYKFKSTPHLPISSSQTTIDRIYVPTNVQMTNIRIGVYIKSVFYSSLRLTLTSPTGVQVKLKAERTDTAMYGSLGSARSYCLFQDGGNNFIGLAGGPGGVGQANDIPFAPAEPLANLNARQSQGWWTLTIDDIRHNVNRYQEGFLEGWVVMFNSVVVEQEVPIWTGIRNPNNLVGIMNGQANLIPNERQNPNICPLTQLNPGKNGEAYSFIINQTQYPGLTVGSTVPGYNTPGRFKVSVYVLTSTPGVPLFPTAMSDIAVYFGKAPVYNGPVNPPVPAKPNGVSAPWPTGPTTTTNSLRPNAGTPTLGGVRLFQCPPSSWPAAGNVGPLDVTFDDLALTSILSASHADPSDPIYSGVYGTYRPEQAMSLLNGEVLNGLYYVTIYDTFGENLDPQYFGHFRVLRIEVSYLAGGGQVENQLLHQGIAGPLMGVPIPGAITGGPAFGYLADVIAPIPPYSINAKDQDPLLVFWATQKMFPRTATGYERVQAISSTGYIPPTGVLYDGPYSYPGALDANKRRSGALVNPDAMMLPAGTYTLRTNLVQARYDDDPTDNQFDSAPIQITPATLAYYGDRINQFNNFQIGTGNQYTTLSSFQMAPYNTAGQAWSGLGTAFTLFKFPTSRVTSVDYSMDRGFATANVIKSNFRISIWRMSFGYFGAPVGPPVAMSRTINAEEYIPGNWRTFPIYACDQTGNLTTNPADLAPGTYAVMLDNMGSAAPLVYPYTYGVMPFMADRARDYQFSEQFGPIGPYATHGSRLNYAYIASPLLTPPANTLRQSLNAYYTPYNASNLGNYALPMRLNLVSMNDFALNYVSINGTKGTEAVSITTAPFAIKVRVGGASAQNGLARDFNVRMEIFQGSQRVYLNDVLYGPGNSSIIPSVPGVQPYGEVDVPMANWTPTSGGLYHVRVTFSRNPDDQNPANDVLEYDLYVNAVRSVIVRGANASTADVDAAIAAAKKISEDYEVVSISDAKLASVTNSTIILTGDVESGDKAALASLIGNGNNIAIMYNHSRNYGSLLRNIDRTFNIQRTVDANYDEISLMPQSGSPTTVATEAPIQIAPELLNMKIESKDDIVKLMKSATLSVEPVKEVSSSTPAPTQEFTGNMIPNVVSSPYGELSYLDVDHGDYGLLMVFTKATTPQQQVTETQVANGFVLGTNYPNPFNPSTAISYTLPEQSVVSLRVIDMLGRDVMTLVSETQNAGTFNVSWNGLDQNGVAVASGQYIYRIDATPVNGGSTFTSMKKMTLAK